MTLSDAQMRRLDEASAIRLGFPHELLTSTSSRTSMAGGAPELVDPPVIPVI